MIEAVMPEELAHMRPVLLLAVGVVVLAIGPAARPRQLEGTVGEMSVQRPVEKLPAVVGVEVLHRIRHSLLELPQLRQHGIGTFVPNRTVFGPATKEFGKR